MEGIGGGNIVSRWISLGAYYVTWMWGARVRLKARPMKIDSKPNSVHELSTELGTYSNINEPDVKTRYTRQVIESASI